MYSQQQSHYDIITRLFIAFISHRIKKFANSNQFVEIYLAIKQKSKKQRRNIQNSFTSNVRPLNLNLFAVAGLLLCMHLKQLELLLLSRVLPVATMYARTSLCVCVQRQQ